MFAHTDRPLKLTTPLGADALILFHFQGREAISEVFHFELKAVWENKSTLLPFDQLLGKKVTVEVSSPKNKRYFNGIVCKVTQYSQDQTFTYYYLEVVPELWLLDRKLCSRTFQHLNVPDILKKVLTGLDLDFQIEGTFQPREYCVQYRESDLAFASRLMEEEGIYYFFKHSASGHQMVLANEPKSHAAIPYLASVTFEEKSHAPLEENRVFEWSKGQEIRSGKFTAWDHTFEMPTKNLEATKAIQESVAVGTVTHKLKVANNESLELYDYPGGYASRFDGVNKSGGDQASDLQHIFEDNQRTVGIRMQEEALSSLLIRGKGAHAGFTAGHTFELTEHYSDNGKFVLTGVEHEAEQALLADDREERFQYSNRFTCIPAALPFRPPRVTPLPTVRGVQTAIVVGPAGEEIFVDKYSRVKVQFQWDREGTDDVNSSCWVRVATYWAGAQWGSIHIPRIGQEVIVDFLEGNVNCPIIVGSVYNADTMPPWTLPDNKTVSGYKSRSTPHGTADNFNMISFEDKKGSELVHVQAEKDLLTLVKNNESREVDHDRVTVIKHDETQTVTNNETITVEQGNQAIEIKQGNQSTTLDMGNQSTKIKMGNQTNNVDLGKIETEAMQSIELKVGQSSIKIDQMGVTIKGMMISIEAQVQCEVKAVMTQVNGDAMTIVKGGVVMIN
uniref:Rhs element Vgr protein n=1 Tax=Solibacter usitatus (strain Ellin6076) TaxID=234267 RepID=Q02CG3_SOLUE